MTKSRLIPWAIVMWITPAVVAEMLGWRGVWGGGSAFGDLILPAPITGGILHVPSFVLAILLVMVHPKLADRGASMVRACCASATLLGLAQIIDWSNPPELQHSYFGLCLMTDAVWSLVWMLRVPPLRTLWVPALALALLPALLYVSGI